MSRLQSRARTLRALLRVRGVPVAGLDESAIIPVHVGDERLAVEAAAQLQQRGIQAPAIRYPTVPRGQAILRLTVMATHTDEQLKQCAHVMGEIFENLGLTQSVE
ncbi:aminotransferase class I/II-fold pyridoxal phosphate-dependent enzyme [Corynebacterium argentoratense]|uniref:aminotransferase class I/II-fold pyridoxal phosphate-dependent enzyme n=1 Tax=Corynebacterium argentoratense TaxID=42817 RepID=UPI002E1AB411|nr:aminotransferase class I/II-fold pyridoxal phosphate-dependent enzyme [Corynebacterium argentoratense]